MPDIDVTYTETCGPTWKAVAGPGRVFIFNDDTEEALVWAIAGAAAPTEASGYELPPRHGSRSGAEAIIVPGNRQLWIRSATPDVTMLGHKVVLTVAALP
ncbi:MAG: hypothetical protein WBA67_09910 [Jannaschia sp.]